MPTASKPDVFARSRVPVLYSNLACPYAHRATLALALRPLPCDVHPVPTTNQFGTIDRLGVAAGDPVGMFADMTAEELHARKDAYRSDVNPSGEVPALRLPSGEVLRESEIVAEYLDAVSEADTPRLVPAEPLLACRMRLATHNP